MDVHTGSFSETVSVFYFLLIVEVNVDSLCKNSSLVRGSAMSCTYVAVGE